MSSARPVRVAIINDYEIVVAGIASALSPFRDRVVVVEIDSGLPVLSDVDVILYDTFGAVQGDGVDLETLVRGSDARVAIFSWNLQPGLVDRSLARGAAAYLSKELSGEDLADALVRVHAGERVRPDGTGPVEEVRTDSWPGREHGLSVRESEVIALIAQGLSNQEIADRSYLSINSVKTYVRTAYGKIGVTRRSQAVVWALHHGFDPDRVRRVDTGH